MSGHGFIIELPLTADYKTRWGFKGWLPHGVVALSREPKEAPFFRGRPSSAFYYEDDLRLVRRPLAGWYPLTCPLVIDLGHVVVHGCRHSCCFGLINQPLSGDRFIIWLNRLRTLGARWDCDLEVGILLRDDFVAGIFDFGLTVLAYVR